MSKNTKKQPISLAAYETLAKRYSEQAEGKTENGYIEHPAMRKQLGKVNGLAVLDAGCGPGILSSWLLAHGAQVTGFDISPKMITLARKRCGRKAKFFLTDMARPLPSLQDNSFDVVGSSLAIDYVRNWRIPLKEFHRVLKRNGRLVLTVQHPLGSYLWYKPASTVGVHYVEATWRGFGGEPVIVPDYYRSFAEIIMPLIRAGFTIRAVVDALPVPALKAKEPQLYKKYRAFPPFMIIEARKN